MMKSKLAVAALVVLALTLGAGAAAAAPNGNGNAPDSARQAGPPTDLPEQVPDFVGDVHDAIGSFLDGNLENLGSAVSDLTPGADSTPADSEQ